MRWHAQGIKEKQERDAAAALARKEKAQARRSGAGGTGASATSPLDVTGAPAASKVRTAMDEFLIKISQDSGQIHDSRRLSQHTDAECSHVYLANVDLPTCRVCHSNQQSWCQRAHCPSTS